MRRRSFEVPADLIVEFAEIMEKYDMDNVIEGVTGDGDIEIGVDYEPEQKAIINKIHDLIDEHNENNEDDEDEEDEDED